MIFLSGISSSDGDRLLSSTDGLRPFYLNQVLIFKRFIFPPQHFASGEGVWTSLRQAFEVIADKVAGDPEAATWTMRVVDSTASLRAHNMEKHSLWAVDLTPEVAKRLSDVEIHRTEAAALVYSALACLDVALSRFASDPHAAPIYQLLDEAFGALAAHCRS